MKCVPSLEKEIQLTLIQTQGTVPSCQTLFLCLPLCAILVFPHTNIIFTVTHSNSNSNDKFIFVQVSPTKWRTSSSGKILPTKAVLWKGNPRNYFSIIHLESLLMLIGFLIVFRHSLWQTFSPRLPPQEVSKREPGVQSLSFCLMSSRHLWR